MSPDSYTLAFTFGTSARVFIWFSSCLETQLDPAQVGNSRSAPFFDCRIVDMMALMMALVSMALTNSAPLVQGSG
jgi:hypothetical protein